MGDMVEFNQKPTRNLYIVDNYHVVLAQSEDEARNFVQTEEGNDAAMEVQALVEQKEVYVIKSGKVEIILCDREPSPLEQLSFILKIRDFIDRDLKRFTTPSFIDVLKGIRPKK